MTYTLGPTGHGTLSTFLRGRRVPGVLGFDPLFQYMHEEDAASAIVLALEEGLRGVFNVAGPSPVPLSLLVEAAGRRFVPLPEALLLRLFGRFGLPRLPPGALSHIKYPVVIDDKLFRQATGFAPRVDETQCIAEFRSAFPPRA
jgi:UDP-glucose 4-epimerase